MTRGDIRNAVEQALKAFPDKTQQAIAEQVGCSQGLVARYSNEFITSNKLEIPVSRTGKDGKQYPTTKKTVAIESEEARYLEEPETERTVQYFRSNDYLLTTYEIKMYTYCILILTKVCVFQRLSVKTTKQAKTPRK